MIAMLESVPNDMRSDLRFQRAVTLAAHLAACRENWLDRMISGGKHQGPWWEDNAQLEPTKQRFVHMQGAWTDYLRELNENELLKNFEFETTTGKYRWNIEGQIMQLIGHAFYHRGQVALLVDQLGGTVIDTDYLYWAMQKNPEYGFIGNE